MLFDRLKEDSGNLAAATSIVNIQRKTVYDWDSNTDDVKLSTKRKILAACLLVDPHETLRFLIEKNANDYHELLGRYVTMLDDEIQSTDMPLEIEKLCPKLDDILLSHIGAIHDAKIIEIDDIISTVNKKCKSIGVKGITQDVCLVEPTSLPSRFIQLLALFKNQNYLQCDEISDITGLPVAFVNEACAIEDYTPIQSFMEATQNDYVQGTSKSFRRLGITTGPNKFAPTTTQRGFGYIDAQMK
jgi:hypothetical protein